MNWRRAILAGVVLLVLSVGSVVGTAVLVKSSIDDDAVSTRNRWPLRNDESVWLFEPMPGWPEEPRATSIEARHHHDLAVARAIVSFHSGRMLAQITLESGWPGRCIHWTYAHEIPRNEWYQDCLSISRTKFSGVLWTAFLGSVLVHGATWFLAACAIRTLVGRLNSLRRLRSAPAQHVGGAIAVIAGGFAVATIVAWVCAADFERAFDPFWTVEDRDESVEWPTNAPDMAAPPTAYRHRRSMTADRKRWSNTVSPLVPVIDDQYRIITLGFPFRSLGYSVASTGETRGVWTLPIDLTEIHADLPRTLPVQPVWPGLIGNTIVYALGLWIVAPLPWDWRRWRRRRRGLCLGCGYDVGDLAQCPECGRRELEGDE